MRKESTSLTEQTRTEESRSEQIGPDGAVTTTGSLVQEVQVEEISTEEVDGKRSVVAGLQGLRGVLETKDGEVVHEDVNTFAASEHTVTGDAEYSLLRLGGGVEEYTAYMGRRR